MLLERERRYNANKGMTAFNRGILVDEGPLMG